MDPHSIDVKYIVGPRCTVNSPLTAQERGQEGRAREREMTQGHPEEFVSFFSQQLSHREGPLPHTLPSPGPLGGEI